jgi:predicted transcriptional regulator
MGCITFFYMKTRGLTIRLDRELDAMLSKLTRHTGKNRSELAREALRRRLGIRQHKEMRQAIMSYAEARGYLTNDGIFAEVS